MFTVELPPKSNEYTTSRMKMWFLVKFQGYKVVEQREVPKATSHGRVIYECRWYLRQPS